MSQGHSLTVTSSPSDDHVSLNNVDITPLPIFDDGFLIIYGIREFFDPDFEFRAPESSFGCGFLRTNSFGNASEALRSGGYSLMAGFLDLQVLETKKSTMMTVFFLLIKSWGIDSAISASTRQSFSGMWFRAGFCGLIW